MVNGTRKRCNEYKGIYDLRGDGMNIEAFKKISSLSDEERLKKIADFVTKEEINKIDEMTEKLNKFNVIDGGKNNGLE